MWKETTIVIHHQENALTNYLGNISDLENNQYVSSLKE